MVVSHSVETIGLVGYYVYCKRIMQLRNSCIVIGELPASFGDFTVTNRGLIIHTYSTSTSYDVPSLVMIIHRREQTRLKIPN